MRCTTRAVAMALGAHGDHAVRLGSLNLRRDKRAIRDTVREEQFENVKGRIRG